MKLFNANILVRRKYPQVIGLSVNTNNEVKTYFDASANELTTEQLDEINSIVLSEINKPIEPDIVGFIDAFIKSSTIITWMRTLDAIDRQIIIHGLLQALEKQSNSLILEGTLFGDVLARQNYTPPIINAINTLKDQFNVLFIEM